MSNPSEAVLNNRSALKDWIENNPSVPIEGASLVLEGVDFSGLNMRKAVFPSTIFKECIIRNTNFTEGSFDKTVFHKDLRNTNFSGSQLDDAIFTDCDLRATNFSSTSLTNTKWHGAKIDRKTKFTGSIWSDAYAYKTFNDGYDQLSLSWYDKWFNWENIRFVGHLPLFAASYLLLTLTLFLVSSINWLNNTEILLTLKKYPITMPEQLISLLLGSTLLAIGATIFEIFCPAQIKEFSLTRWVVELKKPGILYVSDSLQKPLAAIPAFVMIGLGGFLVVCVFLNRIFEALKIAWGVF